MQNIGLIKCEDFLHIKTCFIKRVVQDMIRLDFFFSNKLVDELKNERGLTNTPESGNESHVPERQRLFQVRENLPGLSHK